MHPRFSRLAYRYLFLLSLCLGALTAAGGRPAAAGPAHLLPGTPEQVKVWTRQQVKQLSQEHHTQRSAANHLGHTIWRLKKVAERLDGGAVPGLHLLRRQVRREEGKRAEDLAQRVQQFIAYLEASNAPVPKQLRSLERRAAASVARISRKIARQSAQPTLFTDGDLVRLRYFLAAFGDPTGDEVEPSDHRRVYLEEFERERETDSMFHALQWQLRPSADAQGSDSLSREFAQFSTRSRAVRPSVEQLRQERQLMESLRTLQELLERYQASVAQ